MKIEKTIEDTHQAKLVVEIDPENLESSKRKAAKSIAKRIKIPGFRPGKAPYNVIQKHVGDAQILETAIEILIEDIYPKIIEESEIDPYGPGMLQEVPSMDPPKFEFLVPLVPTVELGDYRDIRIDYEEKEVEKKDIDGVIDNLRDQQAIIEPADRAVEEGDMVYITLSGKKLGEDEQSLINEQRYPVVIEKADSDDATEWPFPGFSRKLLGLNVGDEKQFEYTFSDDYVYDELQDVKAEYAVKIEEIKSRTLPELDDEFAKSVGEYENLDEMIEQITTNLKERYDQEQNSEYESKIIDKIVESSEIKFPPQMVEHESEHYIEDLTNRLSAQGLNLDIYLKSREMDIDALKEEIRPSAEERIKRGLVLMEVATNEEIKLTSEEIEEKTEETISEVKALFPEDQVKQLLSGQGLQNLVTRIVNDEITNRTLTRLKKIAKGEPIEEEEEEEDEGETTEQVQAQKEEIENEPESETVANEENESSE